MDYEIKTQLIKSVDSIKNKIKTIQNEEDAADLKFKKMFKPVTDNLNSLIKASDDKKQTLNVAIDMPKDDNLRNKNENFEASLSSDSNNSSAYFGYSDDEKNSSFNFDNTLISLKKEDVLDIYDNNINIPFGIRKEKKDLMIGDSKVSFSLINDASNANRKYVVIINNKQYQYTPGLKELLMRSKPNMNVVTEQDKFVYKDILQNTNAHKRDFKANGQIKGDKGIKYRHIIKPLFYNQNNSNVDTTDQSSIEKVGGYIPVCKKYKSNTDYIFWDDPNELIERLKLLLASQSAGNTNHDNEILSIIEELKEARIIKT